MGRTSTIVCSTGQPLGTDERAQMKGHRHHGSKTQRAWSHAFPKHKARKDFSPSFYSDLRSKMALRNADHYLDQLQERNNGGGFKVSAKSW